MRRLAGRGRDPRAGGSSGGSVATAAAWWSATPASVGPSARACTTSACAPRSTRKPTATTRCSCTGATPAARSSRSTSDRVARTRAGRGCPLTTTGRRARRTGVVDGITALAVQAKDLGKTAARWGEITAIEIADRVLQLDDATVTFVEGPVDRSASCAPRPIRCALRAGVRCAVHRGSRPVMASTRRPWWCRWWRSGRARDLGEVADEGARFGDEAVEAATDVRADRGARRRGVAPPHDVLLAPGPPVPRQCLP